MVNIALRRFLHNHGNISTEGRPKPGLYPTLISNNFKGSFQCSAQYHRQHYTLQAFKRFGALYMHMQNDKYPAPIFLVRDALGIYKGNEKIIVLLL